MRIKMHVSYDGSNYGGWQVQTNNNSIQGVIEEALTRIHKTPIKITASGRTDAKVHAYSQVFHFDTNLNINIEKWSLVLNTNLPNDIIITQAEVVADDFHARFDAKYKIYEYKISYNINNPFINNYALKLKAPLDLTKLMEAKEYLIGEHDFTSYCDAKMEQLPSRVKTIYEINVIETSTGLILQFIGSGFLRYMVRMLVGALVACGQAKITPLDIKRMLEEQSKHSCPYKAEAQGLYLRKVSYVEYQRKGVISN